MKLFSHSTKLIKLLNRKPVAISNGSFSQIFRGQGHEDYKRQEYDSDNYRKLLIASGLTAFFAYELIDHNRNKAHLKTQPQDIQAGVFKEGLPSFTLEEVAKHATKKDKVWVTYKRGVYDVTEFVNEHPGGDQILLAAGSSVEPFWLLYAAHNNPQVWEMIETMRIGNLSLEDSKEATKNMSDPYYNDPVRHQILKAASAKPFNAEPPPSILVENYLTPNEFFYVRNHLPVPDIDPATYELDIEVEGKTKVITLTLDEIKKFPKHTITATVMCAGNRRSEMTKVKTVKGLNWGAAAVGNATWTGARLRDVLRLVGVNEDLEGYSHVKFEGLDIDPTSTPYAASIPIWKAIDKRGDVILAYEMNGEPIPRDHGYPIRVIVPGVVGARNVKWLGRIVVSPNESDSHWQQNDYKGFSPTTDWDTVDFTKSPAIQELPIISAICKPIENHSALVEDGHIKVEGYAWSGGGNKIVRVDITADCGKTWHVAFLKDECQSSPPQHWGWALWSAKIPVKEGAENVEIWAKAVDSCYNVQPESFENIWNLRGVLNNAYHRVKADLKW